LSRGITNGTVNNNDDRLVDGLFYHSYHKIYSRAAALRGRSWSFVGQDVAVLKV
jgi:hypothetical protein